MLPLVVLILNSSKENKGFTLLELIIVMIIISIVSVISISSLISSQRQQKVNEAFTKIRGALVEAQLNANRQSSDCSVFINITSTSYNIIGTPTGCVLESIKIDKNIVSITKTNFSTLPNFPNGANSGITFTLNGTTSDAGTLWISRKNFMGNIVSDSSKCLVISTIGMIRTGFFSHTSTAPVCNNIENKRYDNSLK